ncbi:MAG: hypothetical protein ACSLFP_18310 [Acidimicrobiales bacterium]
MIVLLQIVLLLITVALVVEVRRDRQRRAAQRATQHWVEAIRDAPAHGSLPTLGRPQPEVLHPRGSERGLSAR